MKTIFVAAALVIGAAACSSEAGETSAATQEAIENALPCPFGDGEYCGGHGILWLDGDGVLYHCKTKRTADGAVYSEYTQKSFCDYGCKKMPPRRNDLCEPPPTPPPPPPPAGGGGGAATPREE